MAEASANFQSRGVIRQRKTANGMRSVRTLFGAIIKWICIAALILVAAGIGSLVLVSLSGVCPVLNEGNISCTAPSYQALAEFGMAVLLLTVFTGLPALLAFGGLVFLVRDTMAWRRRRRS